MPGIVDIIDMACANEELENELSVLPLLQLYSAQTVQCHIETSVEEAWERVSIDAFSIYLS